MGKLPRFKQRIFSKAPIYKDLETTMMEFSFTKMREDLSPDHSFVKLLLGRQSPGELSRKLITGTKLMSIKERRRLFKGGKKGHSLLERPDDSFWL